MFKYALIAALLVSTALAWPWPWSSSEKDVLAPRVDEDYYEHERGDGGAAAARDLPSPSRDLPVPSRGILISARDIPTPLKRMDGQPCKV